MGTIFIHESKKLEDSGLKKLCNVTGNNEPLHKSLYGNNGLVQADSEPRINANINMETSSRCGAVWWGIRDRD
jgi:hypothetical protein